MTPISQQWSAEQIEHIHELRRSGLTLTQIGQRFGKSRNAVGGVISRIKRQKSAPAEKKPRAPRDCRSKYDKEIAPRYDLWDNSFSAVIGDRRFDDAVLTPET